jgi:general secretion pathway protein K
MGIATNILQGRLKLAQHSKSTLFTHAQVYQKRSELIYMLVTKRHTVAGISAGNVNLDAGQTINSSVPVGDELRADGFLYKENTGLTYSIQNEAGLIPVNSSSQYWLKFWLRKKGYNNSDQIKLSDSLADYADPDNLRRAAGTEQKSQGSDLLYPNIVPRNFLLQACTELWQISNWQKLLQQNLDFIDQCSLRRGGGINLNAVPLSLWSTMWPNSVDSIKSERAKNNWFSSYSDILAIESSLLTVSEDYYSYLGSRSFKIFVSLGGTRTKLRLERGTGVNQPITIRF